MIQENRRIEVFQFIHVQRSDVVAQFPQPPAEIHHWIGQVVPQGGRAFVEHSVAVVRRIKIPKSNVHAAKNYSRGNGSFAGKIEIHT